MPALEGLPSVLRSRCAGVAVAVVEAVPVAAARAVASVVSTVVLRLEWSRPRLQRQVIRMLDEVSPQLIDERANEKRKI